jgi:hypothetical protein
MQCLSQALEWLCRVLLGPRTPGRHSRTHAPQAQPAAQVAQDWQPDPCAARWRRWARSAERRRLAGQPALPMLELWRPAETAPCRWEDPGRLVRPYVPAHPYATQEETR